MQVLHVDIMTRSIHNLTPDVILLHFINFFNVLVHVVQLTLQYLFHTMQ